MLEGNICARNKHRLVKALFQHLSYECLVNPAHVYHHLYHTICQSPTLLFSFATIFGKHKETKSTYRINKKVTQILSDMYVRSLVRDTLQV